MKYLSYVINKNNNIKDSYINVLTSFQTFCDYNIICIYILFRELVKERIIKKEK